MDPRLTGDRGGVCRSDVDVHNLLNVQRGRLNRLECVDLFYLQTWGGLLCVVGGIQA